MKRSSKKGFTLAELLIVIAIIAILIAIMVPVFGAQLNKARAAAELANVRAAYSELVADAMLGTDKDLTSTTDKVTVKLEDLGKALSYTGSKVTYTAADSTANTPGKIEVEYEGYKGSFAIDSDVTVEQYNGNSTYTKS